MFLNPQIIYKNDLKTHEYLYIALVCSYIFVYFLGGPIRGLICKNNKVNKEPKPQGTTVESRDLDRMILAILKPFRNQETRRQVKSYMSHPYFSENIYEQMSMEGLKYFYLRAVQERSDFSRYLV